MKNNRTELVFILDRSGSMGGLETDTIGGFNAMLKKQQAVEGDCQVTTVLFDDEYELLHNQMDIHEVKPMTDKEYYVRGCTALYDAVGRTIHTIAAEQRPDDKVLFVIITDGYENASTEYTGSQIKAVIEKMKTERNWQFVFLGANIDAVETAGHLGIAPDRAVNYHCDSEGTRLNYEVVGQAVATVRCSAPLDEHWKDAIEEDFRRRKGIHNN